MISSLDDLSEDISRYFEAKDQAREEALALTRVVIRRCGAAIRSIHRAEFDRAQELTDKAGDVLARITDLLADHPDVRYAGFVDGAEQEYAEARIVFSIITEQATPTPEEVGVEMTSYLGGLGDTTGELRRHILDLIRQGRPEEGEVYLEAMEEIYHLLMLFDYPDAITKGLRRKGDMARSLLERTRGDLTNAIGQKKLEVQLREVEGRLGRP
ncbi:MAG: translin family protein [Methanothrix sp.]|jgi:translin|uniref:Translin family protein n=1 Tax=Methanothrix harundinacea TaxID=301375 RepID=A0A117MDB8_9EURY|nr:MAG: Translin family protein [Methanothrix harundinacea]MDD3709204.1 translin family protein [Methanothrix sp.]MDI9399621.1 translin family protein [Euryarchaeota archaeon]KUK97747.1 MAG: Translin family protein [Methanothrix harundinacea]MCP1392538.1 translin family protein [Methanothrix harundinacea]